MIRAVGAAKLVRVDEMTLLSRAAVEWAAGGAGARAAGATAHELAAGAGLRTVVLVEGASDQVAVDTLAARFGRDLAAEGVCVVPLGGATSIGRFLGLFGAQGLDVPLAGLCDAAETEFFLRALARAGLASGRFQVCVADLEDELIRALGAAAVQEVLADQGDLRPFRTFQKQPAQRGRSVERQLRRFMGTHSGRKAQYAGALVGALDLGRVPAPLGGLLAHLRIT